MKKLLSLSLCLLLLTACAPADPSPHEESGTPVYFLAKSDSVRGSDALRCSYEDLALDENSSVRETAIAVVECLLAGSQDDTLLSPFPEDTTLNSLNILDRRAFVDLSGSFFRLDGIALILADYCLTLSLTAIDEIESVSVTVGGRSLAQQPRQIFRERDIILSSKESALQLVTVSLYFTDEYGLLAAEERTLELYEGDTQSAALITALLEGPQDDSLSRVIPQNFRITSIKTENGICRINLPFDSLASLPDDEQTQRLILTSLAKSLYSLEYIREIRLLTEGEELERFGHISVSEISSSLRG